jgi:hypothetical protein
MEIGGKTINIITVKRKAEVSFENVLKYCSRKNIKNDDIRYKYKI